VDVQELKARAQALVVKGRFERAEVLYCQIVTLVPRDAPAWIRRAETQRRLNRVDDAVWSYRTAATILLSLGHEARAIAGLKLALSLRPEDVDLVTDLIRIEMRRSQRASERAHTPAKVVSMRDLEQHQLALPMLGDVDLRASSESGIVAAPTAPAPAYEPKATPAPLSEWPRVVRVNETEVAVLASPDARWVVVSSTAPLEVHYADRLVADEATSH
jgi:hypothetical protein